METASWAAVAIAVILLSFGSVAAYVYYGYRYQSPIVPPSTSATINLFATTTQTFPTNVTSLVVSFSEIDIHSVNGSWLKLFATQTSVDLVKIRGTQQSIGSFSLLPGSFDSLRIGIGQASEIVVGTTIALQVPASAQTGLAIPFVTQINIPSGSTGGATLTVTVDPTALAAKNFSPTISIALILGVGVTTGSLFTTTISTSTSVSSTTKSCPLNLNFWPFC